MNRFGPGSSDKMDQIIREGKRRHVDGIMISSSDAKWRTVNRSVVDNK